MKKLFFLFPAFALVLSCSSDETSTPVTPPAPIVKYTIALSAGEGGTVSTTGGEYEAGQTVSVTATPQGEYIFKDWSDGNTDATRTITISSNSTLTANFEKRKYPLTINFEGEGEVIEEIINSGRTTEYDSGTTVKLTAVPSEGWEFVRWTGAIESEELEVQLLVSEAKTISATFNASNPIYLDENGITIKSYDWSEVGEKGTIDGVEYTIVDRSMLVEMVKNGKDVSTVVTSKIVDLSQLFSDNSSFNEDISSWDVSNVKSLNATFFNAISFNVDLSNWDVSSVTNFNYTFYKALSFDSDLSDWEVSAGEDFVQMFWGAKKFNSDLNSWDISNAKNIKGMFGMANSFNSNLSSWDVSGINDFSNLFYCANEECNFNGNISNWDVQGAENLSSMFFNQKDFNQDLSSWNVAKVKNFKFTFIYTKTFNGNVTNWDTSSATDMSGMFSGSNFNQDISQWNVSKVVLMYDMFLNNKVFNHDLSSWDVSNVMDCSRFNTNSDSWTLPLPNFTNCNSN